MGFLDNLENSLKNLESREERDPGEQQRRAEERARAQEAAPWAAQLKTADFTKRLLDEAAITGHKLRTKIYMAWLESTLRLEARGRRLELRPAANGIFADFIEPDGTIRSQPVDLSGNPETLLAEWLQTQ
jgi:hypothetical protein